MAARLKVGVPIRREGAFALSVGRTHAKSSCKGGMSPFSNPAPAYLES